MTHAVIIEDQDAGKFLTTIAQAIQGWKTEGKVVASLSYARTAVEVTNQDKVHEDGGMRFDTGLEVMYSALIITEDKPKLVAAPVGLQ